MKLYNAICKFADGSVAHYDGLSLGDLHDLIGTLDNLTITEFSIKPEEA